MLIPALLFSTLVLATISRHINTKATFTSLTIDKKRIETNNNNDKVNLNGAVHYRRDESYNLDWYKLEGFERDFRKIIAMKGFSYIYKRDMFWRTWREVRDTNGVKKMINYKCNQQIMKNSSVISTCGSWIIEDSVPCPYEFYGVLDPESMCGHRYLQPKRYNDTCPSTIKFIDLWPKCDNPVETYWKVVTDFSAKKKPHNGLCNGKDYCEFSTSYAITKQAVIFRIVDTNDMIIYSKILLPNNVIYVCVDNCGAYDPDLRKTFNSRNGIIKLKLT